MYLHLSDRAFPQQKSLRDVFHPASLLGCILKKQITGIYISFNALSGPSLQVLPLEIRWITGNQTDHWKSQLHPEVPFVPLLPSHNKCGSERSKILYCYFAGCQVIKAQKSHQTPSDKKDFLNKVLVI